MIEHRPMTDTASVTMPLHEYDELKNESNTYRMITNTLFENMTYIEGEDELCFRFSVEVYVREILKRIEPERYAEVQEELKQKHEEQEQEEF